MSDKCALWKCDNDKKDGFEFCQNHPPLVDHGLTPNDTVCPACGNEGFGTIHSDLWYCLDKYGYDGCGELYDPFELSNVDKERMW